MAGGEDDGDPTKEKDSSSGLTTGEVSSTTADRREGNVDFVIPFLAVAPVIADAGTTTRIEGTVQSGQVLPFESQVQGHIGRQLRAIYDHVLEQPIPDRLLALLDQHDEARAGATETPTSLPSDTHPSDPKGDD